MAIRKHLVVYHKIDAVVKLPTGMFQPNSGVSASILFFTKTNSGGTDHVWFYNVVADGYSLDDKRVPLLAADKLGATIPLVRMSAIDLAKNNLPDVLNRWNSRDGAERDRPRTDKSFCVPVAEIAACGYDLSLNRYQEVVHDEVVHRPPIEIIAELRRIEKDIQQRVSDLLDLLDG